MKSRRHSAGNDTALPEKFLAQLETLAAWRNAKKPCIYISITGEAPTGAIIAKKIAAGAEVVIPRVAGANLVFHAIKNPENLIPGAFGIPEPHRDTPTCPPGEIDCVIVPGVAFDTAGGRLGHGKGFYDKFFTTISPDVPRIALALDTQIVPAVPVEPHDARMHFVVTPDTLYRIA